MSTHDDSRPNHSVPITILAVLAWIGAFCVLTSASAQEAAPEFCSYHSAVNTAAAVQLEQAYDLICEQLNLDNHHPSSEEVELLNHIRDRIDGYGSPAAEVLELYAGRTLLDRWVIGDELDADHRGASPPDLEHEAIARTPDGRLRWCVPSPGDPAAPLDCRD